MDCERSDGGEGGEAEVEDEFACAGMLRGSLASLHGTVERIFRVTFGIGADDLSMDNNGQIWLKLRGRSNDVKSAKLFVKGLVNQEEQQELSYPGALHCIFKPVVRAFSLITDMVERYEGTQSRRSETTDRGMGETLDSRRAFKSLVENWEDKHILELLVLPALVKEILLELVIESGLGSNPSPDLTDGNAGARSLEDSGVRWDKPSSVTYKLPESPDRWVEGMTSASGKDSAASSFQVRGLAEGADERLLLSPQEVVGQSEAASISTEVKDVRGEDEEQEVLLSVGNKEFLLLLKFFTAMGYTEEIVKRVLARTGPKEASQILDVVQQEQNRSDHEEGKKTQDGDESNRRERNRPCETEHREEEEMEISGGDVLMSSNGEVGVVSEGEEAGATGRDRPKEKEKGHEEDFVLGVVKKAAASCGYMEQKVTKLYNMLPDGSTHKLLLELQREESKELVAFGKVPREMDDVVIEKEEPKVPLSEDKAKEMELFACS
ncbi:hypothetical protein F7725_004798 [Dissostichus mawsoni]|uniref:Uncharacterized protein n=1 Tax=Dissostichus mawsoni TaxID=36200 RepID=A0A7J5XJT9_DISMA|nr:hypothetical protein F7725_004798 [Dissostichus mawsoni]